MVGLKGIDSSIEQSDVVVLISSHVSSRPPTVAVRGSSDGLMRRMEQGELPVIFQTSHRA